MTATLCASCTHHKEIVSGRGSRFWMCLLSKTDPRYPKYPPQPVVRCSGYAAPPRARALELELRPETFAVCRLDPGSPVPAWAQSPPVFLARTAAELSVVCAEERVPPGVTAERGWRCLGVRGPLDLALVGVLSSLTAPLAAAGVAVFAVSSYDTDHLLVRSADLRTAIAALQAAGHRVAAE